MSIKERELRRLIKEKSQELTKLQQEIDNAKYAKILQSLSGGINGSDKVIQLIKEKKINSEDAKVLGQFIGDHIAEIYNATEDAIVKKQAVRARKNEARKARSRQTSKVGTANGVKAAIVQGTEDTIAQPVIAESSVQDALAAVAQDAAVTSAKVANTTAASKVATATIAPKAGSAQQRIY